MHIPPPGVLDGDSVFFQIFFFAQVLFVFFFGEEVVKLQAGGQFHLEQPAFGQGIIVDDLRDLHGLVVDFHYLAETGLQLPEAVLTSTTKVLFDEIFPVR